MIYMFYISYDVYNEIFFNDVFLLLDYVWNIVFFLRCGFWFVLLSFLLLFNLGYLILVFVCYRVIIFLRIVFL